MFVSPRQERFQHQNCPTQTIRHCHFYTFNPDKPNWWNGGIWKFEIACARHTPFADCYDTRVWRWLMQGGILNRLKLFCNPQNSGLTMYICLCQDILQVFFCRTWQLTLSIVIVSKKHYFIIGVGSSCWVVAVAFMVWRSECTAICVFKGVAFGEGLRIWFSGWRWLKL